MSAAVDAILANPQVDWVSFQYEFHLYENDWPLPSDTFFRKKIKFPMAASVLREARARGTIGWGAYVRFALQCTSERQMECIGGGSAGEFDCKFEIEYEFTIRIRGYSFANYLLARSDSDPFTPGPIEERLISERKGSLGNVECRLK